MDIFKNITNFNETVEQPVVGEPEDLILAGGCCLFAGTLGVISNTVGFIAVVTNQKLHTPCFLLISAQLVCACLTALGFATDGAQFVASGAHMLTKSRGRWACFLAGLTKTMTMAPSAVLTCTVGVDRFISVIWHTHYKSVGRRYALISLIIALVVAIVNTIAAAATGPPMWSVIPCYNTFLALDVDFFIYYVCHNLFFCCGSVVIYATIMILVKRRKMAAVAQQNQSSPNLGPGPGPGRGPGPTLAAGLRDSGKSVNQTEDVYLRQQLALLPMMAAMMVLYVITGVVPEMATSLSAFLDQGRYQPRVVIYASVLKAVGTSADVFVLVTKCREFRKSLRRMAYRIMRKTMVEQVNE